MGGTGGICKAVEKDKYWNEFEPTSHKFFKMMAAAGDFRNQLRIPKKFMANFKEEIPRFISLQGPSDSIWRVRVRRTNEDGILCNGWDQFVRDHHVAETDIVVFRYAGNATFRVVMSDMSGCEREGSYFVSQHTMDCSNGICSLPRNVRKGAEGVGLAKKTREASRKVGKEASSVESGMEEEEERDREEELVHGRWPCKNYFISNRGPVTQEEKIQAKQLAFEHETHTHRPYFHVIMKPTHVSYVFTLSIPRAWAFDHLPEKIEYLELRVPPNAKTWLVKVLRMKRKCSMSTTGWSVFVFDNNLEVDDVCVFELCECSGSARNRRTVQLDISIYRVVNEAIPLSRIPKRKVK